MEDCFQHLSHLGHFEYVGMSFGLSNAPTVFQALVFNILRDLINHFVFRYLDDILFFKSVLEHEVHFPQVLQHLLNNHLYIRGKK